MPSITNPNIKNFQQPLSNRFWRSVNAHGHPKAVAGHAELSIRDYYRHRDEFTGTLDSAFWSTANTGAGSAAPVFNALGGGSARFVTGGGNPGVSTLYGANAIWKSDDNPIMHIHFKWPATVTSFVFEFGWVDGVTTKTTQCVSDIDVPTISNGLADGVLLAMDTSQTLITPALVGVGTSSAAAKQNINAGGPNGASVFTPTASKWVDIYIAAGVGVGYCEIYENDVAIGQFSVASGPDTTVLMFPFFLVKDLGTSKSAFMDSFFAIAERNTR